jgi:hypothetical protein
MVRVASELREALVVMLQAAPPDNPAVRRLIDTYRDIARELGQQSDVEHTLRDLLPQRPTPDTPRRASHRMAAGHASRNASAG